ncbi:MAG: Beta-eliminating lyase superfamily, partial [Hyphomicrobiales bacterium]|nr:Beta-eliminating lyase superfamily [Hyphomicrobiales bacterium]
WLDDGHWLQLARHSNACAQRLAGALGRIEAVRIAWPVEANELFVVLPRRADVALKAVGARYYEWSAERLAPPERPGSGDVFVRLVTSFVSQNDDIDRFAAIVAKASAT